MYSFNLDYIFNVVYNILLAIRYVILFWILRVSPADYLRDHQYDSWDGLRDRGWIRMSDAASAGGNTYLGTGGDSGMSWWQLFKSRVFHWNTDVNSFSAGNGVTPDNINFAATKTGNDPLLSNLHWTSIQNPILAFFADLLSVVAFFVLLLLIYTVMQYFFLATDSVRKEKQEARKKRVLQRKERLEKVRERRIESLERQKAQEINREQKIIESKIEEDVPAGIIGLPIDESQLTQVEKEEIKEKKDLLLDYKTKNKIPEKENLYIKTKNINESAKEVKSLVKEEKKENLDLRKEQYLNKKENSYENQLRSYRERWNTVINYMQGSEEALWRIGILEADNLLFDLLTDRGYPGLTMSDKFKLSNFKTLDLAWAAHKIRNRIAHDGSKFILSDRIARNTLELYRSVFSEFKIFE